MVYKSLFVLVFATLFNQTYNLDQIECPKWLPGTNEILPPGVTLAPDLELENRVRCYCEVVKAKEADCLARQVPENICKDRTRLWVRNNLLIKESFQLVNDIAPIPRRDRMMNVTP